LAFDVPRAVPPQIDHDALARPPDDLIGGRRARAALGLLLTDRTCRRSGRDK
jgi:hypothetical protein